MSIVDVFVTTWSSEPYTGGAYSTLGVGATPADRSALTEVLGNRLTFAGEHLSVEHPATMHGAYNSGLEAARRLLIAQPQAASAIIVGAGLSGFAAAQALRSAGLKVTILEATTKIGGRARTDRIWDNRPIHPGAAWIHGPIGNPIAELANSVRTTFPPEPTQSQHIAVSVAGGSEGPRHFGPATALDPLSVTKVLNATSAVHNALRETAEAHRIAGKPDEAIKPTLQTLLNNIEDPSLRAAVGTQLVQHFESLLAGSIDDISLHHGDEPYAYPGGDHYLTTPLETLMQKLTEGIELRLQSPVVAVQIGKSSVHITSVQDFTADIGVVAIPLIPLQRQAVIFDPPLPAALHASLHRLRMGTKTKVFVRFTEKWWGDTQTIWVYPSTETGQPERDASHPLDPTASPLWPEWVNASDVSGVPTLFGFVSGLEGKRIADLASTPQGLAAVRAEVENLFHAMEPALREGRLSNKVLPN
jgi:monoamine oxidase